MPLLHWLTRDDDIHAATKTPYRLLEEAREFSHGDRDTGNMLIQGDNLDALKALLPYYAGKVKCIYIDPPYNTKSAFFEDYDDNIEHAQWLAMMYPRLELLFELLSPDGVILISINDDEAHYLKVICDEIFGRKNFMASLVWNYEGNTDNQAKIINYHEYILVYAKSGKIDNLRVVDPSIGEDSKLNLPEIRNTIVKNGPKNPQKPIEIPAGFPCSFENGVIYKDDVRFPKYNSDIFVSELKTVNDVVATTGWSSKTILENFIKNNFRAVSDSKGQSTIFEITKTGAIEAIKVREQSKGHFLSVIRGLGTTNQMRIMLEKIGVKFTFPKPVNLISYLITAFSYDNAIVLDSFAGSGTTAHAVLNINKHQNQKLKFILVEREARTAEAIIVPRLQSVIVGSSTAEIEATGGGFRFYRLGVPVFDERGHVSEGIKFAPLAAHLWFLETGIPFSGRAKSPFLGSHEGVGYYLLYNGILGDKSVSGGNVLTAKILSGLPSHDGAKVIFGEGCRLSAERMTREGITFRQIPYEIKAR